MSDQIITTLTVIGAVYTKFDRAAIIVQAEGQGETSKKAKEDVEPTIEAILSTIRGFEEQGLKIEKDSLKTHFRPEKATRYEDRRQVTYFRAPYMAVFTTADLDRVDEIIDAFSDLEKAVPEVEFKVSNMEHFERLAEKNAFEVLQERLKRQCETVGIPGTLMIASFTFVNGDGGPHHGRQIVPTAALMHQEGGGQEDDSSPIEINPGLAKISVTLTASFA